MSKLNDLMVYWVGKNWKTTLTGWASALFSLASALAIVAGANGAGATAYWIGIVSAIASAGAKMLNALVAADSNPQDTPKSGHAMPMTLGALSIVGVAFAAFVMLSCTGCVTTVAKQGFGAAQSLNDKLAAQYGQTDTLQAAREALAEVEAQKTGRVLLPRDARAVPAVYVDDLGNVLTNGVTLSEWYVVNRRIAERVAAPPSPVAGPTPTQPGTPPPGPAPATGDLLNTPVNSTVTQ